MLPQWLIEAGKETEDDAVLTGMSCWCLSKGKHEVNPERVLRVGSMMDGDIPLNEIKVVDSKKTFPGSVERGAEEPDCVPDCVPKITPPIPGSSRDGTPEKRV